MGHPCARAWALATVVDYMAHGRPAPAIPRFGTVWGQGTLPHIIENSLERRLTAGIFQWLCVLEVLESSFKEGLA